MLNPTIMATHFIDCVIWTESDGLEVTLDKDTLPKAEVICKNFIEAITHLEDELRELKAYYSHEDCNGHLEAALGNDLWLTSQRHGAGFWDRDTLPEHLQTTLTDIAHKFEGRFYVDIVDGVVYLDLV